jgi:hypothetical protein
MHAQTREKAGQGFNAMFTGCLDTLTALAGEEYETDKEVRAAYRELEKLSDRLVDWQRTHLPTYGG